MTTHTCIRPGCGNSYEDNDVEAYYCPPCNKSRKALAAEIDAKINAKPRKPVVSALQAYDAAHKVRGFISAKDLL